MRNRSACIPYAPNPGIKPATFCCTGPRSNQLSHPKRAQLYLKNKQTKKDQKKKKSLTNKNIKISKGRKGEEEKGRREGGGDKGGEEEEEMERETKRKTRLTGRVNESEREKEKKGREEGNEGPCIFFAGLGAVAHN